MKIGIIGFGRLGKLITRYLGQDAELYVYDINDHSAEISKLGGKPATLSEAAACPIVIPFVPISAFESVIDSIIPHLAQDALVIDVCSVKEKPVEIMQKKLPPHVSILGTHPMFGPDSAKQTLFGAKIVLCPVRIEDKTYQSIRSYLHANGLHTIETTPEEHDRQIAHSLVLTHFIGRGLVEFGAQDLDVDTKGHRRLMKILETVVNDSWQLFEDMNHYNRFAEETRKRFMQSLSLLDDKLEDKSK
jgi:prephenate dehydrogenase